MPSLKIGILEAKDFSFDACEILKSLGEVELFDESTSIERFIRDKDVLFIRLGTFISAKLIKNAKDLKYICSPTTGLNHIDKKITEMGINIVSLRGEAEFLSNIRATAEYVVALALALLRNFRLFYQGDKQLGIAYREVFKGHELFRNTIGIIGMGRIGQLLATYFCSFGATVLYYDTNPNVASQNAARVDKIEQLIRESTIIVLCANYTDENCGMINEELLKLMNGKYFLNAARGELVDENNLIQLIEAGYFAGVGIDVLTNETERTEGHARLMKIIEAGKQNLIYTPHVGGATYESMNETERFVALKLKLLIEGKPDEAICIVN